MVITGPDLTKSPPRSPRVRLGGFVVLPRLLDKGRATIAAKNGSYIFNCPMDRRFFEYVGINANTLMNQLSCGKSDGAVLNWIHKTSNHKRHPQEIAGWSALEEQRAPVDVESRKYFNDLHANTASHRMDIMTWFELLDLDDYVSFGGNP
ncbi:MAG: DUF5069 domain-containing protein [Verrucomicrobia bacterium]|jgi:hypothetical protein|nr:DUF5069 domain-containing protein [Verrucomicrobiota bacterium]